MNDDLPDCIICDGHGELLGHLGQRPHYRCRYCGIEFSVEPARPKAGLLKGDEPDMGSSL